MNRLVVHGLLCGVLVVGCDRPPQAARPGTASPAEPARRDTADGAAERDIYIDSVVAANPVIVYGRARTFENVVSARVLDSRGDTIQEVHGMSSGGEMGQHNPFALRVWLVRDPGPRITAQAFDYSAKDGSVVGLTSREVTIPAARTTATVYFTSTDCTTKAFTRAVPPATAKARLLAEMLVQGPSAEEKRADAYQSFPQGSAVNSVVIRDGVLTVDFNERLQNVGGACTARALRDAITKTLMLPGVKQVVITAAGSRELALQP